MVVKAFQVRPAVATRASIQGEKSRKSPGMVFQHRDAEQFHAQQLDALSRRPRKGAVIHSRSVNLSACQIHAGNGGRDRPRSWQGRARGEQ